MRADTTWLKNAINKGKSGHSLQAIKVYQQWNKEKIEVHIKAEIEKQDAKTKKERMSIRHQVVTKMWEKEDEDVVAKIKKEMDKQKVKERVDISGKNDLGKLEEEQTPKEYDKSVVSC